VEDQKVKAALADYSICLAIIKEKNKTGLMCLNAISPVFIFPTFQLQIHHPEHSFYQAC
jgi:hypothetical protein